VGVPLKTPSACSVNWIFDIVLAEAFLDELDVIERLDQLTALKELLATLCFGKSSAGEPVLLRDYGITLII
jgi:hypothetical protein